MPKPGPASNRGIPTLHPVKFGNLRRRTTSRIIAGSGQYQGYVIASQFRDGPWIYKVSVSDDEAESGTFDNWVPEEWLELLT